MGRRIHSGNFCCRDSCFKHVTILVGWIVCFLPRESFAQFLRLGPFDFVGKSTLEGVYSSNVERERASVAQEEQEDYFIIAALDIDGTAETSPNTKVSVDTGVAVEKHFVRTDLDNSSNPFGRFNLKGQAEAGHYLFLGETEFSKKSQSAEDRFVPGGRKTRDVNDVFLYNFGLRWTRDPLSWGASHGFTQERHEDEQFQDGDRDEERNAAFAQLALTRRAGLSTTYSGTKTTLIESDQDKTETEIYFIGAYWKILERPSLTYSFGLEQQVEDGEKQSWDPRHSLTLSDSRELTETLTLTLGATYTVEQQQEAEDIAFQYNGALVHKISRTASQRISATREPVSTFGSTTASDVTTYDYNFTKTDLLIYNLSFMFSVTYMHSVPKGELDTAPVEDTLRYDLQLNYTQYITRKLRRVLKYNYLQEDMSTEDELMEEHRVSLAFEYSL